MKERKYITVSHKHTHSLCDDDDYDDDEKEIDVMEMEHNETRRENNTKCEINTIYTRRGKDH